MATTIVPMNMVGTIPALIALGVFCVAYVFVMIEEFTHLSKSKPVMLAATLIWVLFSITVIQEGYDVHIVEKAFRHVFLEFAELFMFLFVAMTFVNIMSERNVFEYLRGWLVSRNFTFKKIFWITGILAFFISPIADNLTTSLLMCAVVMAIGKGHTQFIGLSCINIVVAANAGGAFSPFGDVTTLMVWQKDVIDFFGFFDIFVPSVVNFLIPALIIHFAIPNECPKMIEEKVHIKRGGIVTIFLFLGTIAFTVAGYQLLHLPPVFGLMSGLAVLSIFSFYLRYTGEMSAEGLPFNIFKKISLVEWDTLLFFYGILLSVGGLAAFGFLSVASEVVYGTLGATQANIWAGLLSAFVDNIPVMFSILTVFPAMDHGQWLLITLTTGVGGSILSVGSAAGVALMGQARGIYTFWAHLKWSWAIALGYIGSILVHIYLNQDLFDGVNLIR